MTLLSALLVLFVLVCAVVVSFTRSLLGSIIVFMLQSLAICVVWVLLRSPDLAITEAAVGAGVTSLLFFVALKRMHAITTQEDKADTRLEEDDHGDK